jgi:16S rRNA (uracil1498-N3)-methyltransferase
VALPELGPHVFVADLADLQLDEPDRHHLERVLRLRPGDPLTASDGRGAWCPCRLGGAPDPLEPTGPVAHEPAPDPLLTVGFALVKGDRPELIVQKLTELGVDRIVPFAAERSVVRWDDERGARHVERLRRVAREAAMQSHRAWLPTVGDLASFDSLVAAGAVLADRDGDPLAEPGRAVLVGPEGGWSDRERAAAPARVGLGDHVLRVETAAIAAGVLLASLRSGRLRAARPPTGV